MTAAFTGTRSTPIAIPATGSSGPAVMVVSTFPPTQCGLATFAAALVDALVRTGCGHTGVLQIGGSAEPSAHPHLVGHLDPDDRRSVRAGAEIARHYDHVVLQHEFGIWGDDDGRAVLGLLEQLATPVTVTLHSVSASPTASQRSILEEIGLRADTVVVMTRAARTRLLGLCRVDPARVIVVPHGASVVARPSPLPDRPRFLTWGLLGPGKGIEAAIDALAMVRDDLPDVTYTIAGQTHPKVRARSGEQYRNGLAERARLLGVEDAIRFDDTYRSVAEVTELALGARAIVLPYESTDQVTSGVLVDALAAGRPVIATAFPHALELLGGGAGIVVAHGDPSGLADAMRRLADDRVADPMAERAGRIGARHAWDLVARSYVASFVTRPSSGRRATQSLATGT